MLDIKDARAVTLKSATTINEHDVQEKVEFPLSICVEMQQERRSQDLKLPGPFKWSCALETVERDLYSGVWTLNGGAIGSLQISLNDRFELGCDAKAYEIQKVKEGEVLTCISCCCRFKVALSNCCG
jgi:hypothetical protein